MLILADATEHPPLQRPQGERRKRGGGGGAPRFRDAYTPRLTDPMRPDQPNPLTSIARLSRTQRADKQDHGMLWDPVLWALDVLPETEASLVLYELHIEAAYQYQVSPDSHSIWGLQCSP